MNILLTSLIANLKLKLKKGHIADPILGPFKKITVLDDDAKNDFWSR